MTIKQFAILSVMSVLWSLPSHLRCQSCTPDKAGYELLEKQLTVRTTQEAIALTPEKLNSVTEDVHLFLEQHILHLLQSGVTGFKIEAWLRCLQSGPEIQNWQEETNAPVAIDISGQNTTLIISYWLIRGGAAIPSTRPFIDVYKNIAGTWRYEESYGADFIGSTFFLNHVHVVNYGEALVLSGFRIGDPQTPLQVEILGYTRGLLKTIYKSPLIPQARITSISGERITIEQYLTGVGGSFPPLPGVSNESEKKSRGETRSTTLYLPEFFGTG